MLRRKSPSTVTLSVIDLEQKLASEHRTCPTCRYSIPNPMTDKCPRCFAAVPLSEHTNCGECSHQGACEFQKLHALKNP
jgi:ribosomal protein S27AE